MQRLLTVLFPVRNVQSTLVESVAEAIDMATDTGRRFELLVVDDGSTDATNEVAHELACRYPQVRLVRHATPQGCEASIRTGLLHGRGELVVVCEGRPIAFRYDRPAHPRVAARPQPPRSPQFRRRIREFAVGE